MNILERIADIPLVKATMQARKRTGKRIATNVKDGKFQVVDVVYDKKGIATVTELSDRLTLKETINFLNKL